MNLSLQSYIAKHADDYVLSNAAGMILFSIEGLPYESKIQVLEDATNLSTLNPGYYLRFQNRGQGMFHLYGIEVIETGNVIIHENIPRSQLSNHGDKLFLPQIEQLAAEGRILFRIATTAGGGADLHEDLAKHYALKGEVGCYLNSHLAYGDNLSLSMLSSSKKKLKTKHSNHEQMDRSSEIESLESMGPLPVQKSVVVEVGTISLLDPDKTNSNLNKEDRSATYNLMFAAGVFAASVGLGAIIVGALALASIITFFAPPLGIALIVGGALALASGVGVSFFSARDTKQKESRDNVGPILNDSLDQTPII